MGHENSHFLLIQSSSVSSPHKLLDTNTLLVKLSIVGKNCKRSKNVQYSTVQYSTAQYSTVQYSTVQYGTIPSSHLCYNIHTLLYSKCYSVLHNTLCSETCSGCERLEHDVWKLLKIVIKFLPLKWCSNSPSEDTRDILNRWTLRPVTPPSEGLDSYVL